MNTRTPNRDVEVEIFSDAVLQNWKSKCAEWATRRPFYLTRGGVPYGVICARYKDVAEVLNDPERFTTIVPDLPGYEQFNIFKGNQDVMHVELGAHDRLRRLLNPAFGPAALTKLERTIEDISGRMLDEVETMGGEFDAFNDYAKHLIDRVLLDGMFELSPEHRRIFIRMNEAFTLVQHIEPGQPFPAEYMARFQAAFGALAEVIAQRRDNPGEDLISALVTARDAGDKLSDDELYGNLFALCAAALNTTAASMAAALLNLCRHPDQMEALRENPELIPAALEECLRYQGPAFVFFPRFTTVDTEIGGTKIPKDMPVYWAAQAANYDPTVFPDPLRFDIHRNPKRIMTFGAGPHHCLGNRLARQIMQINLRTVLERFPNLRLAEPDREPIYGGAMSELNPDKVIMRH